MEQDTYEEEINVELTKAKAIAKRAKDLQELFKDKRFKSVIMEGFLKDEAAELIKSRMNPALQDEASQKINERMISAVGGLSQYFHKVLAMGTQMEFSIEQYEAEQDRLAEEQTVSK